MSVMLVPCFWSNLLRALKFEVLIWIVYYSGAAFENGLRTYSCTSRLTNFWLICRQNSKGGFCPVKPYIVCLKLPAPWNQYLSPLSKCPHVKRCSYICPLDFVHTRWKPSSNATRFPFSHQKKAMFISQAICCWEVFVLLCLTFLYFWLMFAYFYCCITDINMMFLNDYKLPCTGAGKKGVYNFK